MSTVTPDLSQLKSTLKSVWMAGDFGQIASFNVNAGQQFVANTQIKPGDRILDVACGTGNVSLPAARAGGMVTGVDIAPNLLEQARNRAAAEELSIRFDEGDAEDLPYGNGEFDIVLTMFGAIFGPRPEQVAEELVRVCRPGGLIAMGNWTPEGFVGKTSRLMSKFVPLPPGITPPVLWGDEQVVRQRLSKGISRLTLTRRNLQFKYPFSPKEVVKLFRQYSGPSRMAFAKLDEAGQRELASALQGLWEEHNTATDGTVNVTAEYLDVRAIRA